MIQQKRIKSFVMWCGILSTAFMSIGYDWHNLTSWCLLWKSIQQIASNPMMIIALVVSIYSHANNSTNKTGF